MTASYMNINAWREILARVFNDCRVEYNVSPDWLVNPATRRKLKLDYLYPDVNIAVRITGLTAKGQGRRSDWDVMEDQQRDETRLELCRLNGIQLMIVDPFDDPTKQMDNLLRVISRATRLMAGSEDDKKRKQQRMDALSRVHQQAMDLRGRLSRQTEKMLSTLAEGWRDREAGLAVELQQSVQEEKAAPSRKALRTLAKLQSGQRVVHSHFGDGVVTAIEGEPDDQKITILFDADRERTFLLARVADKLQVA